MLKAVWLASDQLCSKLLKAALPEWLEHYERRCAPLPEAFKEKLSGHQSRADRPPAASGAREHPRKDSSPPGRARSCATRCPRAAARPTPTARLRRGRHRGALRRHHRGRLCQFPHVYRAFQRLDREPRRLEQEQPGRPGPVEGTRNKVPFADEDFHTDNGSEFLNWALHEYLTGRPLKCPGRAAAPIARTTTPTASRRTGRMCGNSSGTSASAIPNWCR